MNISHREYKSVWCYFNLVLISTLCTWDVYTLVVSSMALPSFQMQIKNLKSFLFPKKKKKVIINPDGQKLIVIT